jgi:hypothetical protein
LSVEDRLPGELTLTKDRVMVKFADGLVLVSAVAESVYLKRHKQIFASVKEEKTGFVEIPDELFEILNKLVLITKSSSEPFVDLEVSNGKLTFTGRTDSVVLTDSVKLNGKVKDVTTRVNPQLLQRVLMGAKKIKLMQKWSIIKGFGFIRVLSNVVS